MRMKNKVLVLIMFFSCFLSLCSCSRKVNNVIYYSTQFLDKFELEEVNEDDYNKIPLKEDFFYQISDDKKIVSFYSDGTSKEKSVNGVILNDRIISYNDLILGLVYDTKYSIYDFINDNYIDLNYDLNDYDNMYLYISNQQLYLIGSKEDKSVIYKIDEYYNKEELNTVELNTQNGIAFFYFENEYFVIQNSEYEYYTNCENNLTQLIIDNQLDIIDDEIYSVMNYVNGETNTTSYFFKHTLFYGDDSFEKEFYEKNKDIDDYYNELNGTDEYKKYIKHFDLCDLFCKKNTHIEYAGRIEDCYQFYYNHIYYFLLPNWISPYGQSTDRGYYFIRFDAINSKFEISEFNMDDKVKNVKQVGNQIQMTVALNYDGELVNRVYYIK